MKLMPEEVISFPTVADDGSAPIRQQTISHKLAKAAWTRQLGDTATVDKARLQAYSAPGAGRWQGAVPSKTLDKHLTTKQLEIVTALRLGVDVFEESFLCGLCGMSADTEGIHCMSCTGGCELLTRGATTILPTLCITLRSELACGLNWGRQVCYRSQAYSWSCAGLLMFWSRAWRLRDQVQLQCG